MGVSSFPCGDRIPADFRIHPAVVVECPALVTAVHGACSGCARPYDYGGGVLVGQLVRASGEFFAGAGGHREVASSFRVSSPFALRPIAALCAIFCGQVQWIWPTIVSW